jgi:hypothetical protein
MNKTNERNLVPSLQFLAARTLAISNNKNAFLSSSTIAEHKSLVSNSHIIWPLHQTCVLIEQERRKLSTTSLSFFAPSANDYSKFFQIGKAAFWFLLILGGIRSFLNLIGDYHKIQTAVLGLMVIATLGGTRILKKFVHFEGEEHFFESIRKLTQAVQQNINNDLTGAHIDEAQRVQLQICCKTLSSTYSKESALKAVETLALIYDNTLLTLTSSNDQTEQLESENNLSL